MSFYPVWRKEENHREREKTSGISVLKAEYLPGVKLKRWGVVFLMLIFKVLLKFWTGKAGKINLGLSSPKEGPYHFIGKPKRQFYPEPAFPILHTDARILRNTYLLTPPVLAASCCSRLLTCCSLFPKYLSSHLFSWVVCPSPHPVLTPLVAFLLWL